MIPIQLQLMPAPPEPIAFAANLEHLAALIEQLEAKGVAVKFIEMPTDPSLVGSVYAQATLIALQDRFPPERYPRLAIFNDAVYQTMDGLHLAPHDAILAAHAIRDALARFDPAP
jgi:hypothetical protein